MFRWERTFFKFLLRPAGVARHVRVCADLRAESRRPGESVPPARRAGRGALRRDRRPARLHPGGPLPAGVVVR